MQKPSVGRIVHYQAHGSPDGTHKSAARAAIVTEVFNDTCVSLLLVLVFFNTSVLMDESESPRGGTWRWPPKV